MNIAMGIKLKIIQEKFFIGTSMITKATIFMTHNIFLYRVNFEFSRFFLVEYVLYF